MIGRIKYMFSNLSPFVNILYDKMFAGFYM